jgi:hypothetical protein
VPDWVHGCGVQRCGAEGSGWDGILVSGIDGGCRMCRMGVAVLKLGRGGLLVPGGCLELPVEATRAAGVV